MILHLMCRPDPRLRDFLTVDLEDFATNLTNVALRSLGEHLSGSSGSATPSKIETFVTSVVMPLLPDEGTFHAECRFASPTLLIIDVLPTHKAPPPTSRVVH